MLLLSQENLGLSVKSQLLSNCHNEAAKVLAAGLSNVTLDWLPAVVHPSALTLM